MKITLIINPMNPNNWNKMKQLNNLMKHQMKMLKNVESTKTNDSHRLSTNSSENTYKLSIKDRVKEFNDNRKRKNMPRVHNLIIYHHKREKNN